MISGLTIVVPAYNESENIPGILSGLIEFAEINHFKIIMVNDGSTDKTADILRNFSDHEALKVIHHKINKGYGAAIKTGIYNTNTEYVVTIDADGQHDITDIKRLLILMKEKDADLIIGKRNNARTNFREIGKYMIRKITKILISHMFIHDLNSGFKMYRTDIVKDYLSICPNSMAFSDIIALIFINQRHLVIEVPIKINERKKGKSTISIRTALETMQEIINIVILFNPSRIFIPIFLLLFVSGVIWGFPILLKGNGLSSASALLLIIALLIFLIGLIAEQLSIMIKKNIK